MNNFILHSNTIGLYITFRFQYSCKVNGIFKKHLTEKYRPSKIQTNVYYFEGLSLVGYQKLLDDIKNSGVFGLTTTIIQISDEKNIYTSYNSDPLSPANLAIQLKENLTIQLKEELTEGGSTEADLKQDYYRN